MEFGERAQVTECSTGTWRLVVVLKRGLNPFIEEVEVYNMKFKLIIVNL